MRVAKGQKGRLKASGLEIEIVASDKAAVSTIRFRWDWRAVEVNDTDLRDAAEDVEQWHE